MIIPWCVLRIDLRKEFKKNLLYRITTAAIFLCTKYVPGTVYCKHEILLPYPSWYASDSLAFLLMMKIRIKGD